MNGLRTARLRLRLWEDRDRPVFHRLHSDEGVMRFFPTRASRGEADRIMDEWKAAYHRTGLGFLAAERLADGAVIGMIGLSPVEDDRFPFPPLTVQIGWRLIPEAFRQGYATEGAAACLAHAFGVLRLPIVVAYCGAENHASEAVMRRLGFDHVGDFDHPKIDIRTHPHLIRHRLFRLGREDWQREVSSERV